MAVEVKHPLDTASTDLLEVSRHRLEPLSTKMEERDADVMKVSSYRVCQRSLSQKAAFKQAECLSRLCLCSWRFSKSFLV